eukprot:TRINITY_DN321_c1_g1_i3.p1 TRINITY_DN321_c1_g1~~TRINITY_DN321_c1_g1_i3.p1  ORF type:complete len:256 (+),score=57.35 TRINITY_DN321_c1_g1_i3:82-849(+)
MNEKDFATKFKKYYPESHTEEMISERYKNIGMQFLYEKMKYGALSQEQSVPEDQRKIMQHIEFLFKIGSKDLQPCLYVPNASFEKNVELKKKEEPKQPTTTAKTATPNSTPTPKSSKAATNKQALAVQKSLEAQQVAKIASLQTQTLKPPVDNVHAIFRGKKINFEMKSDIAVIGRSTKENRVDINIALEGPASTVSRKHAQITMAPNKVFVLENFGRKPIIVNGEPLQPEKQCKITSPTNLIEIGGMDFTFEIV